VPAGEDRIREGLERLARVGDAEGAYDQVASKKARRRVVRRLQTSGLVVVVVLGTTLGTYGLLRVFDVVGNTIRPMARLTGNGQIAFVSRRDGHAQIYVMNPDGTHVRRLTNDPWNDTHPSWSPDGTKIAFASDRDGAWEIYVINADGSGVRRLTRRGADAPAWSPDGTKIAFTGDSSRVSREDGTGLFVMDSDGSNVRRLTRSTSPRLAVRSESAPAWAPDGRSIAFAVFVPIPCTGSPAQSCLEFFASQIYVTTPDGERTGRLTRTAYEASTPSWSPNGRQIALTVTTPSEARTPTSRIGVIGPRGGAARLLADRGSVSESQPHWSPDGRQIVFVSNREGNDDIYVMNADGSGVRLLTQNVTNDEQPAWQPVRAEPAQSPPESPFPTQAPTPTEHLSPTESPTGPGPDLGHSCSSSSVTADFDADGTLDTTVVHGAGETLTHSAALSCPFQSPGFVPPHGWVIDVAWGSGAAGSWPLPECSSACGAYAAYDIDRDGASEVAVLVDRGASTEFVDFFQLLPSEAGPVLFDVVPPGNDEHPGNAPLEAARGGSVTHQDFVTCQASEAGRRLLTTSAVLSEDQSTWTLTETVFGFDPSAPTSGDPRAAQAFTVVSTSISTQPADPNGGPPTVNGDQCFESS
jgi:Tol biopolymer transport system component